MFLREAFGPRCAFVYGWMALLVMDPGLTAALGIGFAQYLLAALGLSAVSPAALPAVAIAHDCRLRLADRRRTRRERAAPALAPPLAKLAIVGVLVILGFVQAAGGRRRAARPPPALSMGALAASVMSAFFAFGGWWDLGKMSEEVDAPRRTLPRALVGGVALVAALYALVSLAFVFVAPAESERERRCVRVGGGRCALRRGGRAAAGGDGGGGGGRQPRGRAARRAAGLSRDGARRALPRAPRARSIRGRGRRRPPPSSRCRSRASSCCSARSTRSWATSSPRPCSSWDCRQRRCSCCRARPTRQCSERRSIRSRFSCSWC